uniref:Uncharacterized protein n=1 Tax=Leersia perrieri TaxID=77586 RepID=A0A0D9V4L0_9ORYZ
MGSARLPQLLHGLLRSERWTRRGRPLVHVDHPRAAWYPPIVSSWRLLARNAKEEGMAGDGNEAVLVREAYT